MNDDPKDEFWTDWIEPAAAVMMALAVAAFVGNLFWRWV